MKIGERIKFFREAQNLTQEKVGELIGSTGATITRYEKGQREPSIEVLTKIADALGIELFELMVDKEEVLKKWNNSITIPSDDLDEWDYLFKLLEAHGMKINISKTPDHKDCLDINNVSFIDEDIEGFKNQVFEYIDFLISKQSNKN